MLLVDVILWPCFMVLLKPKCLKLYRQTSVVLGDLNAGNKQWRTSLSKQQLLYADTTIIQMQLQ